MGVPKVRLNEKKRKACAITSAIISLFCALTSVSILGCGAFIQVVIESKTRFLEGFDISVLPGFIMFTGIYGIIQNVVCTVVYYKLRKKKQRKKLSKALFGIIISGAVLCALHVAVGIVCFAEIPRMGKAYGRGLLKAIKRYKSDQPTKYELDTLQITFECCGSNDYRDWFGVNWINHHYLINKHGLKLDSNLGYTNDDVPFSCCSPLAKRPCIHHHVHDNHVHYNYDYKVATTLHRWGCKQALTMYYGHGILTYVGILILSSTGVQIVVVILTRFVQTSVVKALKGGKATATTVGYLFPSKKEKDKKRGAGKPLLKDVTSGEETGDEEDDEEVVPIQSMERKPHITAPIATDRVYANIDQGIIEREPVYANVDQIMLPNLNGNGTAKHTPIIDESNIETENAYANIGGFTQPQFDIPTVRNEPLYDEIGEIKRDNPYANVDTFAMPITQPVPHNLNGNIERENIYANIGTARRPSPVQNFPLPPRLPPPPGGPRMQ